MYKKVSAMNETKRVCCLYRVSTVGQVEKDDIPMQKQFCREFVDSHQGWRIVKEVYEKGVSGFKLSAKERDAVQEIQADAVKGSFDVLLVYMFDRLGRRDDETPFIVEWFVKNGVEVWSAVEGQQRFDSHVDKLLNYIRYWQASGESIKTSVRVKTRMEQLTEKGFFTGGSAPYGYKTEKRGRVNKRNREVCDLVIDEDAAEIVRLIFNKYVNEGYGAQRLCRYLSEMKIVREDGRNFPNTSIIRMLKNPIYTGVLSNGDARSEVIPELQIIDSELFERAQSIMQGRKQARGETPANLKSSALLTGKIYCGYCHNRLTLTTSGRSRTNKDGTVKKETRMRYQCHYKVRHPGECDGQSGYGVSKLDEIIDKVVRMQLERIRDNPCDSIVLQQYEKSLELAKARCNIAYAQMMEKQKELDDYQAEIIRIIRGQSRLSAEMINGLIEKTKAELEVLSENYIESDRYLKEKQGNWATEQEEYKRLKSWADVYDKCSFQTKKMFISYFVKAIYVYRDYDLEIEFNVSFDEFKHFSAK